MHSLHEYIDQEILSRSRNKLLSFIKVIFKKGRLNAILWIRIFLVFSRKKGVFYSLIAFIARNKLQGNYGIELSKSTKIGMGLKIEHPNGIIFGEGTILGNNVTVYHQVTFGIANTTYKGNLEAYPIIGDNSVIYSGAKVLGSINLGKGTVVGANAVLLKDTEIDSVYVGVPAKKIK